MTTSGFTVQYAIRLPNGKLAAIPMTGKALIWDDLPAAEAVLKNIQDNAASIGVPGWSGSIEQRYCSAFVPITDQADQMMSDLDAWLQQQTGDQK